MILVLMGVSGAGKTTVGLQLSRDLGWPFFDADDFHPATNVEKMSRGIPLTDEERWPWLANLRQCMQEEEAAGRNAIFACSALKASYRRFLIEGGSCVTCVYLRGDRSLILSRLMDRADHFMKENMLAGQFSTLEEPDDCLCVDVTASPVEVAATIRRELRL